MWAKKQLALLKEKKEKKEREDAAARELSTSESALLYNAFFHEFSSLITPCGMAPGDGSSDEITTRKLDTDQSGTAAGGASLSPLGSKGKKKLQKGRKESMRKEKKKHAKEVKEKAKEEKKKEKAEKAQKKKQDKKIPAKPAGQPEAKGGQIQKKPAPTSISRGRGKPTTRPSLLDTALANAKLAAATKSTESGGSKVTRSLEEKHRMLGTQLIQVLPFTSFHYT